MGLATAVISYMQKVGRVMQLARRGECAPFLVNPIRRAEDCAPYQSTFNNETTNSFPHHAHPKTPMKKKQSNSVRASALQITFISISALLLTLGAAPARNQIQQKPTDTGMAVQDAQRRAAVSESVAAKRIDSQKPAHVEFSASLQRVGGHEIAGFSAQTAQEENLTPPAGLKPVEQEAWLAMARRQGASSGTGLASFYPARYGEPFVVEGQGVRVAVQPSGAARMWRRRSTTMAG